MLITIEVGGPKMGQLIYVPTTDNSLGGLAIINLRVGEQIGVREIPNVLFTWQDLVTNQVEYVKLYGGSIARPVAHRVA
jgi:hypothetical protein